jgi:hypothetical protein
LYGLILPKSGGKNRLEKGGRTIVYSSFSYRLKGNYFVGLPLGLDEVGHPADDAHLHLVRQAVVVQTGAAQNQVDPLGLECLQLLNQRRAFHHQLNAAGIKADSRPGWVSL